LKKIFGITNEQYNKLEPYILINKEKANEIKTNKIGNNEQKIELNSATIEQLEEIKGIGNYTSNEILKYRKRLGGFVMKEQLLEIKAIKKEIYDNIESVMYVETKKIIKLSLNFSEIEDFASHPYLNYYLAKEILKYRSTNGPYKDKKELVTEKILQEGIYKKIEPYLSLN
jgi:DNA uptake protein ComE-like DNA-binding protein